MSTPNEHKNLLVHICLAIAGLVSYFSSAKWLAAVLWVSAAHHNLKLPLSSALYWVYMKKILVLVIFLSFNSYSSEFPYDQYPLSNLFEITSNQDQVAIKEKIPLNKRYLYLGPERRSSVVEFLGQSRDVPQDHLKFLSDLLKSMPVIPKKQIDSYTKEILVKSESKEFWVLIQGGVYPFVEKEIKVGEKFKIYYFWFGATQQDHIIAINEFSSLK